MGQVSGSGSSVAALSFFHLKTVDNWTKDANTMAGCSPVWRCSSWQTIHV
jgi:hypothetical protein